MAIQNVLDPVRPDPREYDPDLINQPLVDESGQFDYEATEFQLQKGALPDQKTRVKYDTDLYEEADRNPDRFFEFLQPGKKTDDFIAAVREAERQFPAVDLDVSLWDRILDTKPLPLPLMKGFQRFITKELPEHQANQLMKSSGMKRLLSMIDSSEGKETDVAAILASDEAINFMLAHADKLDNSVYEWWRQVRGHNEISAALAGTKALSISVTQFPGIRKVFGKWGWFQKNFSELAKVFNPSNIPLVQAGKKVAKSSIRFIPVIDVLANLGFAYQRFKDGDALGGGLELASSLLSALKVASAPLATTGIGAVIPAALFKYDFVLDSFIVARDVKRALQDKPGSARGLAQDVIKGYGRYGVLRAGSEIVNKVGTKGAHVNYFAKSSSNVFKVAAAFAYGWEALSNLFMDSDPYKPRPMAYDEEMEKIFDTLGDEEGARFMFSKGLLKLAEAASKLRTLDESSPSYQQERAALVSQMRVTVTELKDVDTRVSGRAYADLNESSVVRVLQESGYAPIAVAKALSRKEQAVAHMNTIMDEHTKTGDDMNDVTAALSSVTDAAQEVLTKYFGGNTESFYGTLNKRPEEIHSMIMDTARKRAGEKSDLIGNLEQFSVEDIAGQIIKEPFKDDIGKQREVTLKRVQDFITSRSHELATLAAARIVEQDFKEKFVNGKISDNDMQKYAEENFQGAYDRAYPKMREFVTAKMRQRVDLFKAISPDDADASYFKVKGGIPDATTYGLTLGDANVVSAANKELYERTAEHIIEDMLGRPRQRDINPYYEFDLKGTPFERGYGKRDMFGSLSHLSDDAIAVLESKMSQVAPIRMKEAEEARNKGLGSKAIGMAEFNAYRTLLTLNWLQDLKFLRARATGQKAEGGDIVGREKFPGWVDATLENWKKDYWIGKIFAITRGATANVSGDIAADDALELKRMRLMREWFIERGDDDAVGYLNERLDFYEKALKYMNVFTGAAMYQYDTLPIAMQMFVETPFDVAQNVVSKLQSVAGAAAFSKIGRARWLTHTHDSHIAEFFSRWVSQKLADTANRFAKAETVLGPWFTSTLETIGTSPGIVTRMINDSWAMKQAKHFEDIVSGDARQASQTAEQIRARKIEYVRDLEHLLRGSYDTQDLFKPTANVVARAMAFVVGLVGNRPTVDALTDFAKKAHWYPEAPTSGIKRVVSYIVSRNTSDAIDAADPSAILTSVKNALASPKTPEEVKAIAEKIRVALMYSPNVPSGHDWKVSFAKKMMHGFTRANERHTQAAYREMLIEANSKILKELTGDELMTARAKIDKGIEQIMFAHKSDEMYEHALNTSMAGVKQFAEHFTLTEANKEQYEAALNSLRSAFKAFLQNDNIAMKQEHFDALRSLAQKLVASQSERAQMLGKNVEDVIKLYQDMLPVIAGETDPHTIRMTIMHAADVLGDEYQDEAGTFIALYTTLRNTIDHAKRIRDVALDDATWKTLNEIFPDEERVLRAADALIDGLKGHSKEELRRFKVLFELPGHITMGDGAEISGENNFYEGVMRFLTHVLYDADTVDNNIKNSVYTRVHHLKRLKRIGTQEMVERTVNELVRGPAIDRQALMESQVVINGVESTLNAILEPSYNELFAGGKTKVVYLGVEVTAQEALQSASTVTGRFSMREVLKAQNQSVKIDEIRQALKTRLQEYIDTTLPGRTTPYTAEEVLNALKARGDNIRYQVYVTDVDYMRPAISQLEVGSETYNLERMEVDELAIFLGRSDLTDEHRDVVRAHVNYRLNEPTQPLSSTRTGARVEGVTPANVHVRMFAPTGEVMQTNLLSGVQPNRFGDFYEALSKTAKNNVVEIEVYDVSSGATIPLTKNGYSSLALPNSQKVIFVKDIDGENILAKTLVTMTGVSNSQNIMGLFRNPYFVKNSKAIQQLFSNTIKLAAGDLAMFGEEAFPFLKQDAMETLLDRLFNKIEFVNMKAKAHAGLIAERDKLNKMEQELIKAVRRNVPNAQNERDALARRINYVMHRLKEYPKDAGQIKPYTPEQAAEIVAQIIEQRFAPYRGIFGSWVFDISGKNVDRNAGLYKRLTDIIMTAYEAHGSKTIVPVHYENINKVIYDHLNQVFDHMGTGKSLFDATDDELASLVDVLKKRVYGRQPSSQELLAHDLAMDLICQINELKDRRVTNRLLEARAASGSQLTKSQKAFQNRYAGDIAGKRYWHEVRPQVTDSSNVIFVNDAKLLDAIRTVRTNALKSIKNLSEADRRVAEYQIQLYARQLSSVDGFEFTNGMTQGRYMRAIGLPPTSEVKSFVASEAGVTKGLSGAMAPEQRAFIDSVLVELGIDDPGFLAGETYKVTSTKNMRSLTDVTKNATGKYVKTNIPLGANARSAFKTAGAEKHVYEIGQERVFIDQVKDAYAKRASGRTPLQTLSRGYIADAVNDFVNSWTGNTMTTDSVNNWLYTGTSNPTKFNEKLRRLVSGDVSWAEIHGQGGPELAAEIKRTNALIEETAAFIHQSTEEIAANGMTDAAGFVRAVKKELYAVLSKKKDASIENAILWALEKVLSDKQVQKFHAIAKKYSLRSDQLLERIGRMTRMGDLYGIGDDTMNMFDPSFASSIQRNAVNLIEEARMRSAASLYYVPYMEGLRVTADGSTYSEARPLLLNEVYLPRAYMGQAMEGGGPVAVGTELWIVDSPAYWTDNSGIFKVAGFHDGDGIIIDPHTVRQHQGDFDGDTASVMFKHLTREFKQSHGLTHRGTPAALDLMELNEVFDVVNQKLGDKEYKGPYTRQGLIDLIGQNNFERLKIDDMVYYPDDNIWEQFVESVITKRQTQIGDQVNAVLGATVTDEEISRALAKQVEYGTVDNKANTLARLINFFDQYGDIDVVAIARDKSLKDVLGLEYETLRNYLLDMDLTGPTARAFTGIAPEQRTSRAVLDKYVRILEEQMLIGLDREVAKVPFWTFVDTAKDARIPTFLGMGEFKYDKQRLTLLDRAIAEMLVRIRYLETLADKAAGVKGAYTHKGMFNELFYNVSGAHKATLQQFLKSDEIRSLVREQYKREGLMVATGPLMKPTRKRLLQSGKIGDIQEYGELYEELQRRLQESPVFGPSALHRKPILDVADHEIASLDFGDAMARFHEPIRSMNVTPGEFANIMYRTSVSQAYHKSTNNTMPSRHFITFDQLPVQRASDSSVNVYEAAKALHNEMAQIVEEARIDNLLDPFSGRSVRPNSRHYVSAYLSYATGKPVMVIGNPLLGVEDLDRGISELHTPAFVAQRTVLYETMEKLKSKALHGDERAANALGVMLGSFLRNHSGADELFNEIVAKQLQSGLDDNVVVQKITRFIDELLPHTSGTERSSDEFTAFLMNADRGATVSLFRDWAQTIVTRYEREIAGAAGLAPGLKRGITEAFAYGFSESASCNQPVMNKGVFVVENMTKAALQSTAADIGYGVYDGRMLAQKMSELGEIALLDPEETTKIASVQRHNFFASDLPIARHDARRYNAAAGARSENVANAITHPRSGQRQTPEQVEAFRHTVKRAIDNLPAGGQDEQPVMRLSRAMGYMNGEQIDWETTYRGEVIATNKEHLINQAAKVNKQDAVRRVHDHEVFGARDIAKALNDNIESTSAAVQPVADKLIKNAFLSFPTPQRTEMSKWLQNAVRVYKQHMLGFVGGGLRFLTFNAIENFTKALLYVGEEVAQGNPTNYSDLMKYLGVHGGGSADDVWRYAMSMHKDSMPEIGRRNGMYIRQMMEGGRGMNIWDRYSKKGVMNWDETTGGNFFRKIWDSYENMMSKYMKWVGDNAETPFRNAMFSDKFVKQLAVHKASHADFMTRALAAASDANKTVDELYFDYANKMGMLTGMGQVLFPFGDFRVLNMNYWINRFAANPFLVRFAMRPQVQFSSRKGKDPRAGKFKLPLTDMYVNPFTVMSFNDVLRHIVENPYFKQQEERDLEVVYQKIKDFPEEVQRSFAFKQKNGPQIMEYVHWRRLKPVGEIAAFMDSYLGVNSLVKGMANLVAGATADARVFERQPFKGQWGAAMELINAAWPKDDDLQATMAMKIFNPQHAEYLNTQNQKARDLLVKSMNMSPEEASRVTASTERIRQGIAFVTGLFPQHIPKQLADYVNMISKFSSKPPKFKNDLMSFEKYIMSSHMPDPSAYSLFSRTKGMLDADATDRIRIIPVRAGEKIQYTAVDTPVDDNERSVIVQMAAAQNPLYAEDMVAYYGKGFDEWQYSALALAAAKLLKPEIRREYALRRGINPTPVSASMAAYFAKNRYEYLKAAREFLRSESEGSIYSVIKEDDIEDMREVDRFERRLRQTGKVTGSVVDYAREHFSSWVAEYAAKRYVWDNFTRIDWRKPDGHARRGLEAMGFSEKDYPVLAMYSIAKDNFEDIHKLTTLSDTQDVTGTAWSPAKVSSMSPALRRDLQRFFPNFQIKQSEGAQYYDQILTDSNRKPRGRNERQERTPKQISDLAQAGSRRMVKTLSQASIDWINQHGMGDALDKTMRTGNPSFIRDAIRRRSSYMAS